jgi:hypothetical protein
MFYKLEKLDSITKLKYSFLFIDGYYQIQDSTISLNNGLCYITLKKN